MKSKLSGAKGAVRRSDFTTATPSNRLRFRAAASTADEPSSAARLSMCSATKRV